MRSTLLAAALALAALLPARADTLTLPTDGSWTEFYADANLEPYSPNWADSYSFTIAAGQVGWLTVVDTGFSGERFNVFDHGVLLGQTGGAVQGDINGDITFDFDAALANPAFSRGTFQLGAGTHFISGEMLGSLTDSTIGGIKLNVSAVPEPATYATLLIGLGLLIGALRRRNR